MDILKILIEEGLIEDIGEVLHKDKIEILERYHQKKFEEIFQSKNKSFIERLEEKVESNFFFFFLTISLLILFFIAILQPSVLGMAIFQKNTVINIVEGDKHDGRGIKIIDLPVGAKKAYLKIFGIGINSLVVGVSNSNEEVLFKTKFENKDSIYLEKEINLDEFEKNYLIIKYDVKEGGHINIKQVRVEK